MVFFEAESTVSRTHTKIANPRTIGEHLKKRREELQLHQRDVAKILGVSKESISDWETDETMMRAEYYPAIISFLGYDPFAVDFSNLAERLRAYRKVHGLTQEELGRQVGVSEGSILRWETSKFTPQPGKLKLLKNILSYTELS